MRSLLLISKMRLFSLYRSDFPLLKKKKHLIYFDTAVSAQKPTCVIDAIANFYREEYATVHRSVYNLSSQATVEFNEARKKIASFINANSEEEIIFTRGTTASLNLVARSFAKRFLKKGDVVILTEIEHHANLVPWQFVAEELGVILKFLPVNDAGEIILEEAAKLFDASVKMVSVPHISNAVGAKHPIKEIVALARKWGAKVCVDGAQSAGHIPIDVQDLGIDFFAFSAHKVYGPTGLGILWGRKELLEEMPPIEGGGDMIESVTNAKTTFAKLPLKFEAGTPMISSVIGLKKALDYILGIGIEKIAAIESELVVYAMEKLNEMPAVRVIGNSKSRGALISFIVEGVHPLDLATLLDCKGIMIRTGHLCSQPTMQRFGVTSVCRVSFGLYNTKEEIDIFVGELKNILSTLGVRLT